MQFISHRSPYGILLKSAGLLGISIFAATYLSAQPFLTCTVTSSPNIVAATAVAELAGDVVLNCTGGQPTPPGKPIPEFNFQAILNTDITSRLLPEAAFLSEALLTIDDPSPASPVPSSIVPFPGAPPQILCAALGGSCSETGTGGSPSPYVTQPNVFVGQLTGPNALEWQHIPIDPPGTIGTRIIRITNVRVNAFQLGLSSSLIPNAIFMIIGENGAGPLAISQSSNGETVAATAPGMTVAVSGANEFFRCLPHNPRLLGGSGTPSFDFSVQAQEGFASSFKFRSYGTVVFGPEFPQRLAEQNVPGFQYFTQTGFYSPSLFTAAPTLGLADFGTRIRVEFQGVTAGTHLFVPTTITLTGSYGPGADSGQLQLVQADQTGDSPAGYEPVTATATIGGTPVADVSYSGSSAYAVYEVVNSDPNVVELATIPVAVAFNQSLKPDIGFVAVDTSLAPLAAIAMADLSASLPRFGDPEMPRTAYEIKGCPATPLSGGISAKSGLKVSRVWSIEVDSGASPAIGATIESFTLTQTSGAKCTPVVTKPSKFPHPIGNISANNSVIAPITIDFTGCAAAARFSVNIPLSADEGRSAGSIVGNNELR